MATADELNALADRCEREEASRELNGAIALAAGWLRRTRDVYGAYWVKPEAPPDSSFMGDNVYLSPPSYTTSLDAVVGLVPEGWRLSALWQRPRGGPFICAYDRPGNYCRGEAATEAMARCAAALRARAALEDQPPKGRE